MNTNAAVHPRSSEKSDCYLEQDPAKMLDAVNRFGPSRNYIDELNLVTTYLHHRLHPLPLPGVEEDLKPAGVISVRNAVFKTQPLIP